MRDGATSSGDDIGDDVDRPSREVRGARWTVPLLLGFAVFGIAARLRALRADRSLWLDEAMLACNICGRTFSGLIEPLDDQQGAPVGFLFLARSAVLAFGPSEFALRLVPFLAGLVSLVLVAVFCRKNLGSPAMTIGLALAAVMPAMIYYSAEGKQYALDIAVGLLMPTLAADALRRGLSPARAFVLAVVGMVVVWVSHPSVFILAGAGTTLIVHEALRRRAGSTAIALGVSFLWAASFVASYVLSLKDLQGSSYLNTFWGEGFLSFPPRSASDVRQAVAIFLGMFEAMYQNYQTASGIEGRMGVAAAIAWLAGAIVLYRRGERGLLALLTLPLGFAVVASILHKYPLRVRMTLFAAGPNLLLMTAGVSAALRSRDRTARALGAATLAGLALLPSLQAGSSLLERPRPYGARPVLVELASRWQPGDVVVVDRASEPPFRFYQTYARLEGLAPLTPTLVDSELRDPKSLAAEVRRLKGHPRVWIVFTAHMGDPGGHEDMLLTLTLDQLGSRRETIKAPGYYAHLYDFREPPVSAEDGHRIPGAATPPPSE
ncbi:MAG: hypothetical protein JWN86_859 [Planctomycetota bacterium]|nr:hypothetical protein [Planctomycetota bacterium]